MNNTTNYNLRKPDINEYVDINNINDNMDIIDAALEELQIKKSNGDVAGNANNALKLDGKLPTWYIQSNSNLLINPNFKINQRGLSFYTVNESSIYTVDRWSLGGNGSLQVNKDKIVFTPKDNKWWYFAQKIEQSDTLRGEILTLSALCMCPIGGISNLYLYDYGKAENICVAQIPPDGNWHLITVSGTPSKGYSGDIEFACNGTSNFEVKYCKLELGDHATPFIPRLYGEELALCQRYYETSYPNDVELTSSTGTLDRAFWFSVKKRATPTVSIKSINGTPNKISIHLNGSWQDYDYTDFEARTGWYRIRATQQQDLFNVFAWNWTADAEL